MSLILHDGRTYRPYEYESEEEFEQAVVANSRDIFGPDSVYFDTQQCEVVWLEGGSTAEAWK